jgi:hypothetical protein
MGGLLWRQCIGGGIVFYRTGNASCDIGMVSISASVVNSVLLFQWLLYFVEDWLF